MTKYFIDFDSMTVFHSLNYAKKTQARWKNAVRFVQAFLGLQLLSFTKGG